MLVQKKNDQLPLYRKLYKQLENQPRPSPVILDLKVIEKSQLQANQHYNFFRFKLRHYNKRVENILNMDNSVNQIDTYQIQTIFSLYQIMRDICSMSKLQDQFLQLQHARQWYQEQDRLMTNRQVQGVIRYKTLGRRFSLPVTHRQEDPNSNNRRDLPSQVLKQIMLPYYLKNRTAHQETQIPLEKIKQYKRKILNLQPMIEFKTSENTSRIKFPKPIRLVKEIPQVVNAQISQDPNQPAKNSQLPEGSAVVPPQGGESAIQPQQQGGQQLGLGEQPEQPEEGGGQDQQQIQQQDKLAPKRKIYMRRIQDDPKQRNSKDIEVRGTFANNIGDQSQQERRMEQKYRKLQQQQLLAKKEDEQKVQALDVWSRYQGRMNKQYQKRLQDLGLELKYQYIQEEKPKQFYFNQQNQRKYGFSSMFGNKKSMNASKKQIDLSSTTLPRLAQNQVKQNISKQNNNYQKSVDLSRLEKLKKRFGNMLALAGQVQERQIPKSLCQYTTRFKSFSTVLNQHSLEKQRSIQIQQIRQIKQKLTKSKLGLNVTTLAHGLCLPDSAVYTDVGFPLTDLPKNPFFVDKKKKKKKK